MTSNLTVFIHQFTDDIDALHTEFVAGLGISVFQMLVLNELYKSDGQRASDLALAVGRAATSFTPLLDAIQNAGLICRKPHKKDRRSVQIFLTDEGKALRKDIVGHMDAVEARIRRVLLDRINVTGSISLVDFFAPLPEVQTF